MSAAVRRGLRGLGAVAAGGAAATWLALWVVRPWGAMGIATPSALLVTAIFVGMALAGLRAALGDAPVVLALVGLFSLVPVGLYFMFAPGILPLIALGDVGMLVAGVALVVGDRTAAGPPGVETRPADAGNGGPPTA